MRRMICLKRCCVKRQTAKASDRLDNHGGGAQSLGLPRSDAHGRRSCSWVGSADSLSMPSSTMPMARGDVRVFVVHLLRAAGCSDVEPFLLSAQ